jgi:hypothetical protein
VNYSGLTIFALFFGISLLDALKGGNWVRAGFWIAIAIVFFVLDRNRRADANPSNGAMHR